MKKLHVNPSAIGAGWLAVSVVSSLAVPMAATRADEMSFEYGVEAGYEFNDNVRLTPEDEVEISGGQVIIPATLAKNSERLTASLEGELAFSRYDEDQYDSDDQDLQGNAKYLFERGELEGHAGYLRDSTRTSEFLDTGVVGLDAVRRESATVGGSGSHLFTEKNGLIGGIDYRDVQYDSDRFQDFDFLSGYAGWIHQWSERTRLRFQAYASTFENSGGLSVETDSIGVQGGFDSNLSEQLSTSLLVGWVSTETDYSARLPGAVAEDDADALLLKGTIAYRAERHRLEGRAWSQPNPSANGTMVIDNLLGLKYRYLLSERSNLDLDFTVGQRSALDDRIDNDRDYARFSLRADYQISSAWYVAGRYQYSYQDREQDSDDSQSNAVFLSLIFQPQKSVW